jgi:hypothetical protein
VGRKARVEEVGQVMQKLSIALTAAALLLLSACSESKRSPPDDGDEFHASRVEADVSASKADASSTGADQRWSFCVADTLIATDQDWSVEAVQFFKDSPPWNRSTHLHMSENFTSVYQYLDSHCAAEL